MEVASPQRDVGAELERVQIERVTGEGDAFVGDAELDTRVNGRQNHVSVGLGDAGMGIGLAYAQGSQDLPHMNVQAHNDAQLAAQVDKLRYIVDNFDNLDFDLHSLANWKMDKFQFEVRLHALEAEQARRAPLPPDHPLWRQPGALISPHVGGASSAFFPRADRLMAAQLNRFVAGQPLENVVKPA